MTKRKPLFVTFAGASVLIIGLFHLWQAAAILARSGIAAEYGGSPAGDWARLIGAIAWSLIWCWQAFRLYQQKNGAVVQFSGVLIVYAVVKLSVALMSQASLSQQRALLLLILTLLTVAIGFAIRRFFARSSTVNRPV